MYKRVLEDLFESCIKNTTEQAMVEDKTVLLCRVTNAVQRAISGEEQKVYVTSKMLKHLFDKKPAEEFHFIVNHLHKIVKFPDKIYKNKDGKRGHFCFVKKIKNQEYMCSIEIITNEFIECNCGNLNPCGIYVATVFRLRKIQYLNSYELMWSWKGDKPSS